MEYKSFYSNLFQERHGGAEKERGIWYHGTSMKKVPTIMSRGLDPNVSPKNKSWGSDPNVDVLNLDKTSYGGVYVTKNLSSATSAAQRTSRQDKNVHRAIIVLSLQPRSLTADEDDFASRLKDLKGSMAGSVYHVIYPYMWETYGVSDHIEKWHEQYKNEWCDSAIQSLFYDFKLDDPRLKAVVRQMLYDEGYKAMLTRNVSYLKKIDSQSDYWEWRKAYADVMGLKDYGEEVNIPDPPPSSVGEKTYRAFIDKLTRTMKHKARHGFTGSFSKTARSMEPIKFSGSNKIVAIVELVPSKESQYREDVRVLYGELPEDFVSQWKDRVGELRIIG